MDDLQSKLAGILSDPESLEQVKKMAENLFSQNEDDSSDSASDTTDSGDFPSPDQLGMIMSLMSKLGSQKDDERTRLLHALKPYLSEKRQEKTENAIKILRLLELLPLIKDSGLFNML